MRLVRYAIITMVTVAAATGTAWATVVGEIVSIGFPSVGGASEGRDVVRTGAWVSVVVDLALKEQASFDGWVRVSQPDKDGDLCYDMQKVQLLGETSRRYWLYVLAHGGDGSSFRVADYSVEVLSGDNVRVELESGGQRVGVLTPRTAPETLTADEYLVLSVSKRSVGKVVLLGAPECAEKFSKVVRIAHIDPAQLPARWQGLEIVDAVVWDDADPADLNAAQLDALLEWTRFGGHLVVAAGRTADAVAQSRLGPLLPVELGAVESTTELPRLRKNLLAIGDTQRSAGFPPVSLVTCRARPGVTEIVTEQDPPRTIIARRRVGRGRLTFVAASLRELLGGLDAEPVERCFTRLLELRDAPPFAAGYGTLELFDELGNWVGFTQAGAAFLAVAMLFAGFYVFVATFGSWHVLRKRGFLKHSWSLFGVLAVVASALSVVGVQAVRGVGKKLAQITIVDAESGESSAHATTYFGLKTSMFGRLDVWLADDYPQVTEPSPSNSYLKPLPVAAQAGAESRYADPSRYRLAPTRAEILDVSIRGTVKQFEGRWSGALSGRLVAEMSLVEGPGGRLDKRIAPTSRIINQLGVDLYDCYVIYTNRDVFVIGASHAAQRPEYTYLFRLPVNGLPDGETFIFGDTLYTDPRTGNQLEFEEWANAHTLDRALASWRMFFGRLEFGRLAGWEHLGRHEAALLISSLLSEYRPKPKTNTMRLHSGAVSAERCRQLDISGLIDTQTALFVGFSCDPGPVTICTRSGKSAYQRVPIHEAVTMYRILIPLEQASRGLQTTGVDGS